MCVCVESDLCVCDRIHLLPIRSQVTRMWDCSGGILGSVLRCMCWCGKGSGRYGNCRCMRAHDRGGPQWWIWIITQLDRILHSNFFRLSFLHWSTGSLSHQQNTVHIYRLHLQDKKQAVESHARQSGRSGTWTHDIAQISYLIQSLNHWTSTTYTASTRWFSEIFQC